MKVLIENLARPPSTVPLAISPARRADAVAEPESRTERTSTFNTRRPVPVSTPHRFESPVNLHVATAAENDDSKVVESFGVMPITSRLPAPHTRTEQSRPSRSHALRVRPRILSLPGRMKRTSCDQRRASSASVSMSSLRASTSFTFDVSLPELMGYLCSSHHSPFFATMYAICAGVSLRLIAAPVSLSLS